MTAGVGKSGAARATAEEILKLLGERPEGLTIIEIVSCLRCPADEAIQAIATLQSRRLLHPARGAVAGS